MNPVQLHIRNIQDEMRTLESLKDDFATSSIAMIKILGLCWEMDPSLERQFSITDKDSLVQLGQDAIQHVAEAAQREFARPTPDLTRLSWATPRVARTSANRGPMGLRLQIIAQDMDELMLTSNHRSKTDASELLDLASELLYYCSGERAIADWDNGPTIVLPPVLFNRHDKSNNAGSGSSSPSLPATMFECIALILCELARFHSFQAAMHVMIPVSLWQQLVPGTRMLKPTTTARDPAALQRLSKTGCKDGAEPQQALGLQSLHKKLEKLILQRKVSSAGSLESTVYLALKIIQEADVARRSDVPEVKDVESEYARRLFGYATTALGMLTGAVNDYFNRDRNATTEVNDFLPSSDSRPMPSTNNHLDLRRWKILMCLDELYRARPGDLSRITSVFRVIRISAGGREAVRIGDTHDNACSKEGLDGQDQDTETARTIQLPEIKEIDVAWKTDMEEYMHYALVGLAQWMGSKFDKEVRLWGHTVPVPQSKVSWF